MAAMSNYLENKLIDHVFRGISYQAPATVYAALLTAIPSDGGALTEVSGGGYARVAIASNTTNWAGTQGPGSTAASNGSSGTTSNNVVVVFNTPTGNWGDIVGVALMDAATGGNALTHGALPSAVTVTSTSPAPRFPVGTFEYQIDN